MYPPWNYLFPTIKLKLTKNIYQKNDVVKNIPYIYDYGFKQCLKLTLLKMKKTCKTQIDRQIQTKILKKYFSKYFNLAQAPEEEKEGEW